MCHRSHALCMYRSAAYLESLIDGFPIRSLVGLYAEQTGRQREALGNFAQAFTHLVLIGAAFNLDRMLGSQV